MSARILLQVSNHDRDHVYVTWLDERGTTRHAFIPVVDFLAYVTGWCERLEGKPEKDPPDVPT